MIILSSLSPKTVQEMKHVFRTRAFNTDMRIKYEESIPVNVKIIPICPAPKSLFGVELSADNIL
jgi:hypothetical protein